MSDKRIKLQRFLPKYKDDDVEYDKLSERCRVHSFRFNFGTRLVAAYNLDRSYELRELTKLMHLMRTIASEGFAQHSFFPDFIHHSNRYPINMIAGSRPRRGWPRVETPVLKEQNPSTLPPDLLDVPLAIDGSSTTTKKPASKPVKQIDKDPSQIDDLPMDDPVEPDPKDLAPHVKPTAAVGKPQYRYPFVMLHKIEGKVLDRSKVRYDDNIRRKLGHARETLLRVPTGYPDENPDFPSLEDEEPIIKYI